MENLISNIAGLIFFTLVIGGMVVVMLLLHFLSTYFREQKGKSQSEVLSNLRKEVHAASGVSPNSLFYQFFFRK